MLRAGIEGLSAVNPFATAWAQALPNIINMVGGLRLCRCGVCCVGTFLFLFVWPLVCFCWGARVVGMAHGAAVRGGRVSQCCIAVLRGLSFVKVCLPILCCDGADGCGFGLKMHRVVPGAFVVSFFGAFGLFWQQARDSIVALYSREHVSRRRFCWCASVRRVESGHAPGSASRLISYLKLCCWWVHRRNACDRCDGASFLHVATASVAGGALLLCAQYRRRQMLLTDLCATFLLDRCGACTCCGRLQSGKSS